jgi:hypothetical protein
VWRSLSVETARAECRAPGSPATTEELQFGAGALYNPHHDEFVITYADGATRAVRLRPDGNVLGESMVSVDPRPDKKVFEVKAAYDPDRGEYLVVWRRGQPNEIFARYLDDRARPIGDPVPVVVSPDQGSEISVVYAPRHGRYLVLWNNGRTHTVHYRMLRGGSESQPSLIGGVRAVETNAVSGVVAYGQRADRFLVAFSKDFAPEARRSEIYARFIDGAGESVGELFPLSTGARDQQRPRIGYADTQDRFLVIFEDWRAETTNAADVNGVFVDGDGTVSARLPVAATVGPPDFAWDAPGELAFNAATGRFLVAWYLAEVTYAREVDATSGALGPILTICDQGNASPTAAAARPSAENPRYLVTWRGGFRGLYAGLVDTPPNAHDGGRFDGGQFDGGQFDGGQFDGGQFDGGQSDGGQFDGGQSDGGDAFPSVEDGAAGSESPAVRATGCASGPSGSRSVPWLEAAFISLLACCRRFRWLGKCGRPRAPVARTIGVGGERYAPAHPWNRRIVSVPRPLAWTVERERR